MPAPSAARPWPGTQPLPDRFFDPGASLVARQLLGKVVRHRVGGLGLGGSPRPPGLRPPPGSASCG